MKKEKGKQKSTKDTVSKAATKKISPSANYTTSASSTVLVLPPLPPIAEIKPQSYEGPTKFSNWVIPSRLLMGAYPRGRAVIDTLDVGVTTFVCLVEVKEIERYGHYLPLAESKSSNSIKFIHFPIRDRSVHDDDNEVIKLVTELEKILIQTNDVIYLHCMGGHGRTGTIISILLSKLYGIDSFTALEYCQTVHDTRKRTNNRSSPENSDQRKQVHKICSNFTK